MNPARHALLGHQGGWDEVLMVVVPLVAIGVLLWVANRRVSRQIDNDPGGGAKGERTNAD